MKNYTDFIDVTLSDFSNDPDIKYTLNDFKKKRKAEMRNREMVLRKRGLSDDKVISDLIISENIDARHDFIKEQRKAIEDNAERTLFILKILLSVVYFMIDGIFFILDSFYNDDWAHSWIIIAGGIVLYILILFLMPEKYHYKGRRRIPFNYAVTISVLVVATFIFLVMEIVYNMHYSGIIFSITGFFIFFFDSFVPLLTNQKYGIWHSIFSVPLSCTCLYLTLCLRKVVPWQTGWLLIIAGMAVSIVLFVFAYNKKHRLSERINEYRSRKDAEVTESE